MIKVKNMNRFISRMCMAVLNIRIGLNICHIENDDGTYWWYNPMSGQSELIDGKVNIVIKKEGTMKDRLMELKDEILMHNVNSSCAYENIERIIEEEHGYEKNNFFFIIPKDIVDCVSSKPLTFKRSYEHFRGVAVPKYNEKDKDKDNCLFKDEEGNFIRLTHGKKYSFFSIHSGVKSFIFVKTDNPKYDLMFRFSKSPWQFNHWMVVLGVDKG